MPLAGDAGEIARRDTAATVSHSISDDILGFAEAISLAPA